MELVAALDVHTGGVVGSPDNRNEKTAFGEAVFSRIGWEKGSRGLDNPNPTQPGEALQEGLGMVRTRPLPAPRNRGGEWRR